MARLIPFKPISGSAKQNEAQIDKELYSVINQLKYMYSQVVAKKQQLENLKKEILDMKNRCFPWYNGNVDDIVNNYMMILGELQKQQQQQAPPAEAPTAPPPTEAPTAPPTEVPTTPPPTEVPTRGGITIPTSFLPWLLLAFVIISSGKKESGE